MAVTEAGAERISAAQTARWEAYRDQTTHCPRGHDWATNARWKARGTRYCRQCNIDDCKARRTS